MADVTDNIVLYNARGTLGDGKILKRIGERTFLCNTPDMSGIEASASQKVRRAKLKRANSFAKAIIADPALKSTYPVQPGKQVYNTAVQDYMNDTIPEGFHLEIDKLPLKTFTLRNNRQNTRNLRQSVALDFLTQFQTINNSAYQKLNNVSKATATRDLEDLVRKKRIKSTGAAGAGASYFLIA